MYLPMLTTEELLEIVTPTTELEKELLRRLEASITFEEYYDRCAPHSKRRAYLHVRSQS